MVSLKRELSLDSKLIENIIFYMSNGHTVIISCSNPEGTKSNVFALSWLTFGSYNPPLFLMTVSPGNFSHSLIKVSREFVINVPSSKLKDIVGQAGSMHGDKVDKIKKLGLTPLKAKTVKAPLIEECFLNIECKVTKEFKVGDDTIFVGKPTAIHYDEGVIIEKGFAESYKDKKNQVHYLDIGGTTV